MRKIVATSYVTLDGVMEAPERWSFQFMTPELGAFIGEGFATSDALLMGRVLYEEFAATWPKQGPENPYAERMNSIRKYVVSSTLRETTWQNSTALTGDPATAIANLKAKPGMDIAVTGSATTVRWLLNTGLLDRLQLIVCPVITGSGRRLFPDGTHDATLRLADTTTFDSGVVVLAYEPTT